MEQGQDDGSEEGVCNVLFSSVVPEVNVGGLGSQKKEMSILNCLNCTNFI